MKERPILFKAEMVRAIIDGRKTQTRRIIKPQPIDNLGDGEALWDGEKAIRCKYGQAGDRLWVKETWRLSTSNDCACYEPCSCKVGVPIYRATYGSEEPEDPPWRSPFFMKRNQSRITLEITDVRVERLQDISEEDARAEGTEPIVFEPPFDEPIAASKYRAGYINLWESINGPDSWDDNPWVWVISFKRIDNAR